VQEAVVEAVLGFQTQNNPVEGETAHRREKRLHFRVA
jgi:hypothetical protein